MTKEKPVPLPILVDKIGGAICGIILALKIMGCIIIFLYIAPVTKDLYSLHKEGKIIFKTDEKWVSFKKFDWENFLNNLKPEEKSLGTEKEQKTTKEEPKEE